MMMSVSAPLFCSILCVSVTPSALRPLVFTGLASLRAATLSRGLSVFDHLIESGLRFLHQSSVRSTALLLCALLLYLINGLRSLCLSHLAFTVLYHVFTC